jgi:Synergist-CTERM protein sorting domain-containing protein
MEVLGKSASESLAKAGVETEKIRQQYRHLGAVRADLETFEVEMLKEERPDLLFIPSGMMLYHSEVLESNTTSETPWHVLKAQPLQEYAAEVSADHDSVLIFVLDTGVDTDHSELTAQLEMTYAKHFYQEYTDGSVLSDDTVSDYQGHGSEVAGTIVGTTTGVAPNLKVVPIRSATDSGGLSVGCLSAACNYIMGLKEGELAGKNIIINLSYNSSVYSTTNEELSGFFDTLFAALKNYGILFVSSAGNDGIDSDNRYIYPTRNESSNYVAAASVGSDGELSGFSDYGDSTVEVAAPGSSIYTTDKSGSYVTVDGTSFASPFTTGIAGLIWALDPSLEYWEVRNLLINAVGEQEITTSFIDDYSGTKDDYTGLMSGMSSASYEEEDVEVISGKALFPDAVVDSPYRPDPANGEEHVPFNASLSWNINFDPASFDVYFGTSRDDLASVISGDTSGTIGLATIEDLLDITLAYDTNYYWRVDVHSGTYFSQGSVWRFGTLSTEAYDNTPINGAQGQDTEISLSWEHDLEGGDCTFDIYFSSDESAVESMASSVQIASGISETSVNVSGLQYGTTYYWRVASHFSDPGRDFSSSAVEGDIMKFTTISYDEVIEDEDTTEEEDKDPDLYASGGGGGGCNATGFVPGMILLLLPLVFISGKSR